MNSLQRTGALVVGLVLFVPGVIWALGGHKTWRKMPSRLDAPTLRTHGGCA
jgi:hypothetical protein